MPKFYIHETILCEVTFVREVGAESAEAALFADAEMPGTFLGSAIGDVHGMASAIYETFDAVPHNLPAGFRPENDAAPDLLVALKRWEEFARDNGWTEVDCTFLADTRAAIAKAEGRA